MTLIRKSEEPLAPERHASPTHISAAMPAATHEAQARAEQLQRQLELQLTPQRIEAAQAQARAKSLDTIVQIVRHGGRESTEGADSFVAHL